MFLQLAGLWLLKEPTTLLTLQPTARHPHADHSLTLQGRGCPCKCKISILANHSLRNICFKSIKSGTPTNSTSKAEITWGCTGPSWEGTPLLLAVFWRHSCTTSETRGTSSPCTNLEARPRSREALLTCGLGAQVKQRTPPPPNSLCNLPTHLFHQWIIPLPSTSHLWESEMLPTRQAAASSFYRLFSRTTWSQWSAVHPGAA